MVGMNNFLKANKAYTKQNKVIEDNLSLLRPVYKSLSTEEKDFLVAIKAKMESFKNISDEEVKKILNIRNSHLYKKELFRFKNPNEEARDVIFDAKFIFIRHLKDIIFKLRNLYTANKNSFNEEEITVLSFFKNLDESKIDYKKVFDILKVAFKKDISFDLSRQDLLDLYSHLEDIQIISIESFEIDKYDLSKYKRILEIRNRNISYLN